MLWRRDLREDPRHFSSFLIKPGLGILGRKWAFLILAEIGLRRVDSFNRLLRSNPTLTPRVLSRRLRELREASIITRTEDRQARPTPVSWILTEQGRDLLPVIIRLLAYGARWSPDTSLKGRLPRILSDR
ncbi:helix-turn-helix transcriptional regulator [Candidatus Bathyarchaeota archaeon]|nr:MAG: helix-turn-helix transcriptional regulator [Candidatus Bathyarchaeota archaeon]